MKHAILGLAASVLLAAAASSALAGDWEKLGSREVSFHDDHDTIDCTGEGRFTALKFEVEDGNIEMFDIKVTLGNGETFSPETRVQFDENSHSRSIDLPGESHSIRKIEFWYKAEHRRGHATVTAFGRSAERGGDEARRPVAPADDDKGWELLGTRTADFGGDHDTIEVTANEGKFRLIRLEVEDGNVDLYDVKVTFGDGDRFSPPTRYEFKHGTSSRTIDLPGDERVIRKVEFNYRSESRRDKGRIRLYGYRAGWDRKEEKWDKLGSRVVDFGDDRDVIEVGAVEGRFNAIRLDVEDGNLDMFNLRVRFEDGEDFSPETRFEFKQGSMSRTIDLPGSARVIRKVEFRYKSESHRGRATIHLFGRQAGGGEIRTPVKEPKDRFEGWDFLGARVVDFGDDHDAIDCRGDGRFTAFQVEVEHGDLEMFDIVVTFENGDKENVKTRCSFDENTRTRVIDLPGNRRSIKRVDFYYKSVRATRDGKATINLYGKHQERDR